MKTLKIPQGNAFAAHFPIVVKEEDGTEHPIDTRLLTDVAVQVLHNGITENLSYVADSDGITVTFPATLPVDIYSVFINGKLNGRPVASNMRDVVNIVRWNEHANFPDFIPGDTLTAPTSMFIGNTADSTLTEIEEIVSGFEERDISTLDKLKGIQTELEYLREKLNTSSVCGQSKIPVWEYLRGYRTMYQTMTSPYNDFRDISVYPYPTYIEITKNYYYIAHYCLNKYFGSDFKMYKILDYLDAWQQQIFTELLSINFDNMSGTGGNDGFRSGQVATTLAGAIAYKNQGVASVNIYHEYVYEANGCIKLGNSTAKGVLKVKAGQLYDKFCYRFRAFRWQGCDGKLLIKVVSTTKGTVYSETVLTTSDNWQEYAVIFTLSQTDDVIITITNNAIGDRCFIDNIRLLRVPKG